MDIQQEAKSLGVNISTCNKISEDAKKSAVLYVDDIKSCISKKSTNDTDKIESYNQFNKSFENLENSAAACNAITSATEEKKACIAKVIF